MGEKKKERKRKFAGLTPRPQKNKHTVGMRKGRLGAGGKAAEEKGVANSCVSLRQISKLSERANSGGKRRISGEGDHSIITKVTGFKINLTSDVQNARGANSRKTTGPDSVLESTEKKTAAGDSTFESKI